MTYSEETMYLKRNQHLLSCCPPLGNYCFCNRKFILKTFNAHDPVLWEVLLPTNVGKEGRKDKSTSCLACLGEFFQVAVLCSTSIVIYKLSSIWTTPYQEKQKQHHTGSQSYTGRQSPLSFCRLPSIH